MLIKTFRLLHKDDFTVGKRLLPHSCEAALIVYVQLH